MAAGHLAIDWTPPVWKYGRSKVRLWLIKVGLLSVLRQLGKDGPSITVVYYWPVRWKLYNPN